MTQLFFQFFVIHPIFKEADISLALSPMNFFLLVLSTLLITAGGNVINDVFDYKIDQINKGEKQILKTETNLGKAKVTYAIIVLIGAIISFFVAYDIANLKLFLIYPAAVSLLFIYSFKLKHIPIIGNVIVSTFIALVIFILVFAERVGVANLAADHPDLYPKYFFLVYGFMWFAFITNWVREIIKDIEDIDGDKQNGSKSLPIVIGIKGAQIVSVILLIVLVITLVLVTMRHDPDRIVLQQVYEFILLLIPLSFIRLVWRAVRKEQFHKLSQFLKLYMILGLVYLLFYYNF